jgi:hypothetical protein
MLGVGGGITDETYNNYYRNNPEKLVEFYCNVKLKFWQKVLLRLCRFYKNEDKHVRFR